MAIYIETVDQVKEKRLTILRLSPRSYWEYKTLTTSSTNTANQFMQYLDNVNLSPITVTGNFCKGNAPCGVGIGPSGSQ